MQQLKNSSLFQGRLKAHKWLIARRLSQVGILALFLLGPVAGIWILEGNLAAGMTLDVLPLTDPFLLLQSLLAGNLPVMSGVVGTLILLVFYALVGGRVFCSWVCPVNPVTDAAAWLRRRFALWGNSALSRRLRYWLLGLALLFPLLTGVMVWESINPVSLFQRGLIFGMGGPGLDGHRCPVPVRPVRCQARLVWSPVSHGRLLWTDRPRPLVRVSAAGRDRCNDCMDCFAVCPEPQVIKPALKGAAHGVGPVIADGNCTNCGRCLDVCPQGVFRFGTRTGLPNDRS